MAAPRASSSDRGPSSVDGDHRAVMQQGRTSTECCLPCAGAPLPESWSDYGAVVLQMAIFDRLLRIEKLDRLAPATLADAAD